MQKELTFVSKLRKLRGQIGLVLYFRLLFGCLFNCMYAFDFQSHFSLRKSSSQAERYQAEFLRELNND